MKSILNVPRNAWVEAEVAESVLLIDARNYYRTLYRTLEQAENYVVISGWQFETGVRLLRGQDAANSEHPVGLLDFLGALCEKRPELQIYVLAWDFSLVYARERESGQAEKFNGRHPHLHFQWDTHPSVGGSHHQKFVAVDGAIGFIGGIDLCDARWDDCDHRVPHPDRVNVVGDPCKPYHDVQACFTGPLVTSLVELFVERWQRAGGDRLQLPTADEETRSRYRPAELSDGLCEPISGARTSKAVSLAHPELASVPAARGRESRSSRQIALTVCQPKVFYAHSCVPRGLAPSSDGPRWHAPFVSSPPALTSVKSRRSSRRPAHAVRGWVTNQHRFPHRILATAVSRALTNSALSKALAESRRASAPLTVALPAIASTRTKHWQ